MTDEELEELRAEAKKELEKAKKAQPLLFTREERRYRREFQERCEAEGMCKKIIISE